MLERDTQLKCLELAFFCVTKFVRAYSINIETYIFNFMKGINFFFKALKSD